MGKSKAFKFAFRLTQVGPGHTDLFGTDRKMTPDELEQMRRDLNKNNPRGFINLLWIVNQKTGTSVASSGASKLKPEPLFQVMS